MASLHDRRAGNEMAILIGPISQKVAGTLRVPSARSGSARESACYFQPLPHGHGSVEVRS